LKSEGIAKDAVVALEGDVSDAGCRVALDQSHAFGVAEPVVADRLAVGSEDRANGGVTQAFYNATVIVELGAKPSPRIGDRQQGLAGGVECECRVATEMVAAGEQADAATEDQLVESLALGILTIEIHRQRRDSDLFGLGQHARRLVGKRRQYQRHERGSDQPDGDEARRSVQDLVSANEACGAACAWSQDRCDSAHAKRRPRQTVRRACRS